MLKYTLMILIENKILIHFRQYFVCLLWVVHSASYYLYNINREKHIDTYSGCFCLFVVGRTYRFLSRV